MKVLVTGAAGYIGSICSEVLVCRGHQVIALDNLQEGHRAAVPPAAIFCQKDLAIRSQIEEVFSAHKPDAVMHFAGEALVAKSVREPSTFYAANVGCGVNLLDAMVRHGVSKLIFSSTAATYGEPEVVPIPEDHRKAPINPYGKSKLTFEQILGDYRAYTGLKYVTLRYFNAAGRQRGARRSTSRGDAPDPDECWIRRWAPSRKWKFSALTIQLPTEAVCAITSTCWTSPIRIYVHWKRSNACLGKRLMLAIAAASAIWKW